MNSLVVVKNTISSRKSWAFPQTSTTCTKVVSNFDKNFSVYRGFNAEYFTQKNSLKVFVFKEIYSKHCWMSKRKMTFFAVLTKDFFKITFPINFKTQNQYGIRIPHEKAHRSMSNLMCFEKKKFELLLVIYRFYLGPKYP